MVFMFSRVGRTMYDANIDETHIIKVEFPGLDANGGPAYIGTACFHRRDTFRGKKYKNDYQIDWRTENDRRVESRTTVLEETCKTLASCSCEENTDWGKEVLSPSPSPSTHEHTYIPLAHTLYYFSTYIIQTQMMSICRWDQSMGVQ